MPRSLGLPLKGPFTPHNIDIRGNSSCVSICEQWGLRAPLGAAELYREGSCCWRCLFPTYLVNDTWSLPSLSRSTGMGS